MTRVVSRWARCVRAACRRWLHPAGSGSAMSTVHSRRVGGCGSRDLRADAYRPRLPWHSLRASSDTDTHSWLVREAIDGGQPPSHAAASPQYDAAPLPPPHCCGMAGPPTATDMSAEGASSARWEACLSQHRRWHSRVWNLQQHCAPQRRHHLPRPSARGLSAEASLAGGRRVVAVPLAQLGEGIAECELLEWKVEEGQEVCTTE